MDDDPLLSSEAVVNSTSSDDLPLIDQPKKLQDVRNNNVVFTFFLIVKSFVGAGEFAQNNARANLNVYCARSSQVSWECRTRFTTALLL